MNFTCETPTLGAADALKERLERIESRSHTLKELERYLERVRRSDRIIDLGKTWR